jgi:dolichol kinase
MNERELARQIVHFSGVIVIYFLYTLGKNFTLLILSFTLIFLIFLTLYKLSREKIKKCIPLRLRIVKWIESLFFGIFDSLERQTGVPFHGAISFFLSITLILIIFPTNIVVASIIVLCVYDSIATLIGIHWGKHKLWFNPRKSFEGSFSGFLASFLVCLFFFDGFTSFIASFVGMLVESLPLHLNDNITIPFSVAIVLSFV